MSKDLLYKPNLTYDKDYYTEGNIYTDSEDISNNDSSSSNNLTSKVEVLEELKNELLSKLPLVPESVKDIIKPSIDLIGDVVDDLVNKKDDFEDDKDDDIEIMPVYPSDNDSEKVPTEVPDNPFKSESTNTITLPDTTIDIEEEIEKKYAEDLTDILSDYIKKQNNAIQNYINSLLTYAAYAETTNMNRYTSKTIKNKNLTHITDYITKSKISIRQQIKLYNKLFTIDETIYHLKSVKVAKEQLKRYKLNEEMEDKNLLTKSANDLLTESILIAEKKYEENFYGLYKYLNSSVILFNECMNTFVKQKRSLILLNNEERE